MVPIPSLWNNYLKQIVEDPKKGEKFKIHNIDENEYWNQSYFKGSWIND